MKKRIFSVILVCILMTSFTVAGCGKDDQTLGGMEEDYDYLITVGFVQSGEDSDWKNANTESFKTTFIEENGYELIYEDTQSDLAKQQKEVRKLIKQSVDYLVIAPVIDMGWDTVLKEAKEANIPVILVNNQVDVEDTSLYEIWLGSDFRQEGEDAAEWLETSLSESTEPEQNLVMIQGIIGTMSQMGRTEGFGSVAEDHAEWKVVGQQTGEDGREKAKEVMSLFLEKDADIDVVIAGNDEMALGAIEAIEESGKTTGPDGDMTVISFGGSKEAVEAIRNGRLNVTFECNPLYGRRVAEIIQKLESGVALEQKQYIAEEYFDTTMDLEKISNSRTY